jgi:hypothetical protein
LDNPLALYDASVMALRLTTLLEKSDIVDTLTVCDDAPNDAFQLNVGVTLTPVAPSAGDASVGADGAETTVVKLLLVENALVPPSFVALTLQ